MERACTVLTKKGGGFALPDAPMKELTKKVYVYNKNNELLAYFDGEPPSYPENRIDMMIEPTVTIESNGAST